MLTSLIHQSASVVWVYGRPVPGLLLAPKARVRPKLPIGVCDLPSCGVLVSPEDPTCEVSAGPTASQPPPGALFQACRTAVVEPVLLATTVMTWDASPVEKFNGRALPVVTAGAAGLAVGLGVTGIGLGVTGMGLAVGTGVGTAVGTTVGTAVAIGVGIGVGASVGRSACDNRTADGDGIEKVSDAACGCGLAEAIRTTVTTAANVTRTAAEVVTIRRGRTRSVCQMVPLGRAKRRSDGARNERPRSGMLSGMVLEVANIDVIAGHETAFAEAYRGARHLLLEAGAHSAQMTQGIESPQRFVLLVQWDSVQAHEDGFRQTERFGQWRAAIGPHFANPPLVEHFVDV